MKKYLIVGAILMIGSSAACSPAPTALAGIQPPHALPQIAFFTNRDGNGEIYIMNTDGSDQTNLTRNPATDSEPAWSPDGSRIAFTSDRDGKQNIFVMNADGSQAINLTKDAADDNHACWSPDGKRIAFNSYRDGYEGIYVMNADGSNPMNFTPSDSRVAGSGINNKRCAFSPDGKQLAFSNYSNGESSLAAVNAADGNGLITLVTGCGGNPAWSPDGKRIVYVASCEATNDEIFIMNADGTHKTNLTNNPATDNYPSWSPDGKQIVFESNRNGNNEIYVMNADGTNPVNLTNNAAYDVNPSWSPK